MNSHSDEAHFQHRKTGQLHSNFVVVENKSDGDVSEEHY